MSPEAEALQRIVFLGMGGDFSHTALKVLLDGGAQVAAVVFPRPTADHAGPRWMPASARREEEFELVLRPVRENILTLAGERGIPVLEVGSMKEKETISVLRGLEVDLALTACFPQILPHTFLEIPKLGCLNIHPSLLPAYRGPEPLFWQFRAGEEDTGVTVHWIDSGVDTGEVLGQTKLVYAEGIRFSAAERMASQAGAELVVKAIRENTFPRIPQGEQGVSHQGQPQEKDRRIPANWGVRRAFNFMRAADIWAPFWIETGEDQWLEAFEAVGYEIGDETHAAMKTGEGGKRVQMADGVLIVS
jgi:methionyl-tRNA formyltransferase